MSTSTLKTCAEGSGVATGEAKAHSIGIAGLAVVIAPDTIRTVLGSCIGAALFDTQTGVGGMVHIILPSASQGSGDPKKFADTAIDMLVTEMISAGAQKSRIQAKIVGGACMFGDEQTVGLGQRNVEAVEAELARHAIPLTASCVGGTKGRRMVLDPSTGNIDVAVIGEPSRIL